MEKENKYLQGLWTSFEEHASLPAVYDRNGERVTTYRELSDMTKRFITYFGKLNLPEGSFIPILLPSCAEYLACQLGTWMSGLCSVPMGPSFPQERIDYIKEHSRLTQDDAELGIR